VQQLKFHEEMTRQVYMWNSVLKVRKNISSSPRVNSEARICYRRYAERGIGRSEANGNLIAEPAVESTVKTMGISSVSATY